MASSCIRSLPAGTSTRSRCPHWVAAARRDGLDDFVVNGLVFVAIGRDDAELADAVRGTKQQIAFYASTPAYRGVLEAHDRGELQPELTRMSTEGKWAEMGELIDDELLDLVAVVGDPGMVGRAVVDRWGGIYDRMSLYVNYTLDLEALMATVEAVRQGAGVVGGVRRACGTQQYATDDGPKRNRRK
ncbi:MAG: LLM class flavin-dependent oxidoreductase [Acidimicrobiia bacterium]|nr:LLM class flavin-dependent oxidoreductase [Acidimicrobiia bacterium]